MVEKQVVKQGPDLGPRTVQECEIFKIMFFLFFFVFSSIIVLCVSSTSAATAARWSLLASGECGAPTGPGRGSWVARHTVREYASTSRVHEEATLLFRLPLRLYLFSISVTRTIERRTQRVLARYAFGWWWWWWWWW